VAATFVHGSTKTVVIITSCKVGVKERLLTRMNKHVSSGH
jgi:hypothetical protein